MSKEQARLKVGSFFSGIGGFDLGFERAGFEISTQCEIDEFCNKVLDKQWPDLKRYRDVKKIEGGSAIPVSDVWVGHALALVHWCQ